MAWWGNTETRLAGQGDVSAVLDILRMAREESPYGAQLCSPDSDRLTEQLGTWLGMDNSHLIIAETKDRIVGFALTQVVDANLFVDVTFLQIEAMYVNPEFRRRGVGRSLMGQAAAIAVEAGATRIVTIVLTGARQEQRFLSGLGFAPAAARRIVDTETLQRRLEQSMTPRDRRIRGLDELIARRRQSRDLTATQ